MCLSFLFYLGGKTMQFDPTTLLDVASRIGPAPGLITQLLVGDKIVYSQTSKVDQDFYESTKKMAPIVARKMGGKVVNHTAWANYEFVTPYCSTRWNLDDDFLEKRMPGEPVVNGMSMSQREDAWQAQRIAEAKAMVTRRVEWYGATLLSTGILTLAGDGYEDEIDLGHTLSETLAADVRWSAAGADPIGDLERWQLECLNNGGVTPNICVMGNAAGAAFMKHTSVVEKFKTNMTFQIGRIEPRQMPDGAKFVGYLAELDLEIYVHGAQYESEAGVMTRYFPTDRVALFPSAERNSAKLVYGAIRDAKLAQWFETDVYPRMVTDEDSNTSFLEVISKPLLVFVEMNTFYWADVV